MRNKGVPYIGLAADPSIAKGKQEVLSRVLSRNTPETRDSAARTSTLTSRKDNHSSPKRRNTKISQNDDARNSLDRAKKFLSATNSVEIKD